MTLWAMHGTLGKIQFEAPRNELAMTSSTSRLLDVDRNVFEQLYFGRVGLDNSEKGGNIRFRRLFEYFDLSSAL